MIHDTGFTMELHDKNRLAISRIESWLNLPQAKAFFRAARFLFSKALLIAVTIFFGVFITVLIANQSGQMERQINQQIERYIRSVRNDAQYTALSEQDQERVFEGIRTELQAELGLNLSFWPRHMLWTFNALKFDWGRMMTDQMRPIYSRAGRSYAIRDVVFQHLPNTALLVGAANLLVFLFGMPLSLYLAGKSGSFYDRLIALLAPLSSVPSWVLGILLISLFAVKLRILPIGGMFDKLPPDTPIGYVPVVLRHMILPVMAIFISLFFQLVYSWRTFFIIYAAEDYVELGKAKGLPPRLLQKQYILRPALSYIITNFALTLVGFWQMTMALEVIFDWPGIGWLYVEMALPNFWGESMYPGELLAAVGVVVVFAYLLGFVVFLLDFIYVLVDPRISISYAEPAMRLNRSVARRGRRLFQRSRIDAFLTDKKSGDAAEKSAGTPKRARFAELKFFVDSLRNLVRRLRTTLLEIRRYPSAMAGLVMILVLVLGSVYAIVFLPYQQIGSAWSRETLTGEPRIPKLAGPAWVNLFRPDDYLSVMALDSQQQSNLVIKRVKELPNEMKSISLEYVFNYSYAEFPQELYLYLDPEYREKRPFVSLLWITPDGRRFELKGSSSGGYSSYDFAANIPYKRMVRDNQNWQQWFDLGDVQPTPPHYVLFADPESEGAKPVRGNYLLLVEGLFFEPEGDLEAELVLLGQVYGLAGTDYLRRDLIVPLLWGMPFALLFGLLGATLTTVISMIMAASGVWFGGWVDNLIQRVTEANMVLPILAISVLAYALLGIDIWIILVVIVLLNVFGSPTKNFRAAFLQAKQAPYIEAARAYGATDHRIIFNYLIPRIIPVLVPQLITLIPSFVFLEATLGIFNIKSNYPTWGMVIYQGLTQGALYGPRYWVLEPLTLLLLTGLAFAMMGFALDRILNPRLLE
jgi:peptide/nickel transport system permease protein